MCQDVPGPQGNAITPRYRCLKSDLHLLCENCKKKCRCRGKVGKLPCKLVDELLDGLPWYCKNYKYGCRQILQNVNALEFHQKECIFRLVYCCISACNQQVIFKDYLEHFEVCRNQIGDSGAILLKEDNAGVELKIFGTGRNALAEHHRRLLKQDTRRTATGICPCRIDCFGEVFFLIGSVIDHHLCFMMLTLTESPERMKKYKYTLKIQAENEEYAYSGKFQLIEKKIDLLFDRQGGLMINLTKAKRIEASTGKLFIQVEINKDHKMVEEDADIESGVSDVSA